MFLTLGVISIFIFCVVGLYLVMGYACWKMFELQDCERVSFIIPWICFLAWPLLFLCAGIVAVVFYTIRFSQLFIRKR